MLEYFMFMTGREIIFDVKLIHKILKPSFP